ncbi:MAG TPA: hypothetical protein VHB48_19620, partial [Chitinophagaceae bacterium]|nr:hypothetical protein [Chitinophagaceae bacterium]
PADAVTETISDENGPACVVSSLCCNIEGVNVSTGISNINGGIVPAFLITTNSPIPIQEIEISLIDYHAVYNNASCRPANLGNLFGHIQPFVGYSGGTYYNFNTLPVGGPVSLQLQTAINPPNNSLTWSGTNPINLSGGWNFNGLIALNFVAPDIVNLDCCSGTVFFCFKVRIKDANCNICEKTVCFSATIPKKGADNHWTDEKAKDRATLQNLNSTQPGNKTNTQTFEELFKRNK